MNASLVRYFYSRLRGSFLMHECCQSFVCFVAKPYCLLLSPETSAECLAFSGRYVMQRHFYTYVVMSSCKICSKFVEQRCPKFALILKHYLAHSVITFASFVVCASSFRSLRSFLSLSKLHRNLNLMEHWKYSF